MSKTTLVMLIVLGLLVVFGLSFFFWTMGIKRTENVLAKRYSAQENVVETTLDKMRKTLINQFKVKESFANDFIKVVAAQAEGRKGGSLVKLNAEAANKLGITPEIYMTMMNSISGEMDNFKRSQDTFTDIWREHETWCTDPYHAWLIGNRVKPRPEMISSEVAKEAMQTKKLGDGLLE